MEESSYIVPIEDIRSIIESGGYERVLLQVPEGMKREAKKLGFAISDGKEVEVIIDGEPCFGACDHAGERGASLGVDAVIHLGHAVIPSVDEGVPVPVHFFPVRMRTDPDLFSKGIDEFLNRIGAREIGLTTTIQHIDLLKNARSLLEDAGREVHIGDPGGREAFGGQILGCSFRSAGSVSDSVSVYLYIGTGRFHPMGLYLSTRKPVWMLDPLSGRVGMFDPEVLERFMRKRYAAITRAGELMESGEAPCILVTGKPGQKRMDLARDLKEEASRKGSDVGMVHMDLVTPMKIRSLGFKLCCSTACPRIVVDDSDRYLLEGITLLTPTELRIALGLMSWDDYELDEEW